MILNYTYWSFHSNQFDSIIHFNISLKLFSRGLNDLSIDISKIENLDKYCSEIIYNIYIYTYNIH